MNLFSLYATLTLDTKDYEKGVNDADKSAKGLKGTFTSLISSTQNMRLKSKTAAAEHKVLSAEFKEAKSKVTELSKSYVEAISKTGATSKETRELQEKLKDAKTELSNVKQELEKYPSALDKAKNGISSFGSALLNVGSVAVKGIATATAAAGTAITALGAIGFNYNKQMETYTTNFAVMLGSQEAAARKVNELKEMAAKTPFEMSDLAQATQTLLAFNVSSEESTGILSMLGDISLGNSQKLESLTRAYGKMNAAQKVTLEDINMMIDAGYNPLLQIAEKTGETMSDVYDRISDGGVSVEEITEAMQEATEAGGQFYQGMEQASLTTEGLMSTLKDNFNALVGEVFEPLSETIKSNILPTAIGYIDQLTEAFRTNGIEGLVSAASEILSNILITIAENLPYFIEMAANMVVSLIEGLGNNTDNLVTTIISITFSILEALGTILPKLATFAVEFLLKLGGALIDNLPKLVEKVKEIGTGIVEGIKEGIKNAWDGLVTWFNGIWDGLFGNRNVTVSANGESYTVNGSHRNGLNYVPFDGYIAELHKGERVLTADEARAQDNGKAGGVTIIQNIYSEAKTAADLMSEALYQQERAVLLGV